jgi:hypothetical protein
VPKHFVGTGLSLQSPKLHIHPMATKMKKAKGSRRSAAYDRPVIYRGIKIEPMRLGKRSPLAQSIRDELRKSGEALRRKSSRRSGGQAAH